MVKFSKTLVSFVCLLLVAFVVYNATSSNSVTLAWDPSPSPNITDYHIYYGVSSMVYTNAESSHGATILTITGLRAGVIYHFAATASDANGSESDFSNEVSYRVPFRGPSGLQVIP